MPDALTALTTVGQQLSDPEFLNAINQIPASARKAFAENPAAWLNNAGYPVPAGLTVSAELIDTTEQPATDIRENFGLGKFKICVGPPWAQICYAHGPGEHT